VVIDGTYPDVAYDETNDGSHYPSAVPPPNVSRQGDEIPIDYPGVPFWIDNDGNTVSAGDTTNGGHPDVNIVNGIPVSDHQRPWPSGQFDPPERSPAVTPGGSSDEPIDTFDPYSPNDPSVVDTTIGIRWGKRLQRILVWRGLI